MYLWDYICIIYIQSQTTKNYCLGLVPESKTKRPKVCGHYVSRMCEHLLYRMCEYFACVMCVQVCVCLICVKVCQGVSCVSDQSLMSWCIRCVKVCQGVSDLYLTSQCIRCVLCVRCQNPNPRFMSKDKQLTMTRQRLMIVSCP